MYRDGECSDESNSSDDGLACAHKCFRMGADDDSLDPEIKMKKKLNIWSDVLQEQAIAEGLSGSMDINGETGKVDRGVESYTLPAHRLNSTSFEHRLVQDYTDNPFEGADFDSVDKTGVSVNLEEDEQKGHRWHGRYSKSKDYVRRWADSRGRPSTDYKDRGHSDDIRRGVSRGKDNRKRRWYNRQAHTVFVSDDYSLDSLMATDIPLGLPIDELGQRIAKALGERDGSTIITVVELVGETLALKLFEEARKVEASGGMLVADGTRRRTPGGVFMVLFKANPDVPSEAKEKMNAMHKAFIRDTKKAKRSGTATKSETELKPLPSAIEAIRGKCESTRLTRRMAR